MASSSGSRSRSIGHQVQCFHHDVAPVRTVKVHGPTFGKRFYGCSHWPNSCGFFKWADEEYRVQELQFQLFERDTRIAELELRNGDLETDLEKVMRAKRKLEDKVAELAIENTEQLSAIASARADKRIYNVLVASWIFFAMCVSAFVVLLLMRAV